jgi:glycine oxidase
VPSTPDVIILGAGIIGCACAHELAHAGARVSVFDTRRVGEGASQASAGVLAPYIEGHEHGPLRELGRRSLDLYDDLIQRLTVSAGLAVQYGRSGTLEVALERDDADRLRGYAEGLKSQGLQARWLEPTDLRLKEPLVATDALGGLLIGVHGFVGVPDLLDALAASAMRAGATFALETRVISVESGPGGRLAVVTENGPSFADRVVLAAGCWAGQIAIEGIEPIAIQPVRGQLIHLAWPTAQPLRHIIWSSDCYIVPWLTGRVLVGATVEDAGFDERATAAGVRDLLEAGCSLIPHLWQASFVEVRVGLRPRSPDGLPLVGASNVLPGLVYATGHYRNGVLLAPLTAAVVRDLIMDQAQDPGLAALAPSRFGAL